jgi:transcription initiation factor IIE alpha subunit
MKEKHYNRFYRQFEYYGKCPRKIKKAILGKKMSGSKLRRQIKHFDNSAGIYFCPECGCESLKIYDHGVQYPEVWYDAHCLRCSSIVGTADNSEFQHVLDYSD